MFTGIIEDTGEIVLIQRKNSSLTIRIKTALPLKEVKPGDSIAVNGMCLTVTDLSPQECWISMDAVAETMDKTTVGEWREGTHVNLERALVFGGRLDGHLVSGHVDGTGRITRISRRGDQVTLSLTLPTALRKGVVKKGSIALNGISLTIAECQGSRIDVAVIPFTFQNTTLSRLLVGSRVNLEVDMIAKHVANILGR